MTGVAWLTRWRRPPAPVPADAFVICEAGVPVVVCLDRASVKYEVRGRTRAITRVHQVPILAPRKDLDGQ